MAKGTLIKIDIEGKPTEFRCESKGGPTVEELQKALGGHFVLVWCIYQNRRRPAYIDENGDPKQLPENPFATRMVKEYYAGVKRPISISESGMVRGNIVVWVPDEPKPTRAEAHANMLAARKLSTEGG